MHFVVIGKDKGDLRRTHRAGHLEQAAAHQHSIVYAGPILEEGRVVGSVLIFDLPDRAALDSYMEGDPYFNPGIFETVEVYESRWMVPEREPGFLLAEAGRARADAG